MAKGALAAPFVWAGFVTTKGAVCWKQLDLFDAEERLMQYAFILAPLLAALSACASTVPEGAPARPAVSESTVTLSGTALYRERIALPRDAVLTIRISDVSRLDVAAPVIAETQIPTEGKQVPLAFSLDYNGASIDPRRRYAVSARITDGTGNVLWITDTHTPLPAPGQPVALHLVQAG